MVIKKTPGRGCRYLGSGLRLRHTRGGEARPWTNCCWDCARAGSRLADDPEPKVSAAKIDSDFRKGSCTDQKCYSVLCASKRTRGAVVLTPAARSSPWKTAFASVRKKSFPMTGQS
ncbi:MAG: hypothetical protein E5W09_32675 [Mesorhizobium sp.]|nr:MAG: hypothetical protein E5W09_32675 [Mesorhizobium sp.]TIX82359.1 MAG: hypothetical protein E5V24_20755 [Mesorhizobium sp.]TKD46209.1 MAG: hypothetical protein E5W98_11345 [Mesorhizobium sp.]